MNQPAQPPADPRDAIELLEDVLQSNAMIHVALVGLTAIREKAPDYSETLRGTQERLDSMDNRLGLIEAKPALQLTPAIMADEFGKRALDLRAEDRLLLAEAKKELARVVGELESQTRNVAAFVPSALASKAQKKRQFLFGAVGLVAGILLWSFLPGAVARSLPDSWGVPQWMAERMIGNAAGHEDAVMEPATGG